MKSRLSIVTIAIAALLASYTTLRGQEYGWPDQNGYAQPAQFVQPPPPGYAPPPPGYAPPGYPPVPEYGPGIAADAVVDAGPVVGVEGPIDPVYPWRWWGTVEGTLSWRHTRAIPTLFTTSPPGTPIAQAGVLGQPGTTALFGGNRIGVDPEAGGSFLLGAWLDELSEIGVAGRGFIFADDTAAFNFASNAIGEPTIARPVIVNGQQGAILVAFNDINNPPPFSRGSVSANASNKVWGAETYVRVNWDRAPGYSIDLLGGYLYTRIDDNLNVGADFFDIDPTNLIIDGTRITQQDNFTSRNDFHGAQIGISTDLQSGRFTARLLGKAAFGNMHQNVNANGSTTITVPGFPPLVGPGFLAGAANSGIVTDDVFCVVPEANLSAGFQVNDYLNVSVGYNFIYWTRVALAGEQISPVFPAPAFAFQNSDFWVQGLSIGVNGRF